MLHCSGDGFQLSWASVKSAVTIRAASLFFSASETMVGRKLFESKNIFMSLYLKPADRTLNKRRSKTFRKQRRLSLLLQTHACRESFSFQRRSTPVLHLW